MEKYCTVLVLVLLVLILPQAMCTVNYVVPTSGCLTNETECHNLSYYINRYGEYFVSDATFQFLDGQHILNQKMLLTISNVSGLTLQSNSTDYTPLISCNGEATSGIAIVDSTDIVIENIAISNCGGPLNVQVPDYVHSRLVSVYSQNAALAVVNATNTTLNDLHITSSRYIGLLVVNGYDITVTSSMFVDNSPNMLSFYTALSVCDSNVSNITLSIYESHFMEGSLGIDLLQGCSYRVIIILDAIQVHGSQDNNIDFNITTDSTMYTLHATDIVSMRAGGVAFSVFIHDDDVVEACCTSPQQCLVTIERGIFSDNNGAQSTGGLSLYLDNDVQACHTTILVESCTINNNRGRYAGMQVLQPLISSNEVVIRNCTFQYNSPISEIYASIVAIYSTRVVFENVTIRNTLQWGLLSFSSVIELNGSNYIINTTSGMGLFENSRLLLLDETASIYFINNTAERFGGAIFLGRSQFLFSSCFVAVNARDKNFTNGGLFFYNNTAGIAGGDIYGVSNGTCSNANLPMNVFHPSLDDLSLSSPPVAVCFCDNMRYNSTFDCSINVRHHHVAPGTVIGINVIPVGYGSNGGFATTRGTVEIVRDGVVVERSAETHQCTSWMYMTKSSEGEAVELIVVNDQRQPSIRNVTINITFTDCPRAFRLVNGECQCSKFLKDTAGPNVACNVTTRRFHRNGEYWIGNAVQDKRRCVAARSNCPLDYCNSDSVYIDLAITNESDAQCALNRSGLLCGECAAGLSLMLGSNKCGKCSNIHLLLILPFAVAGFALVVFLFLLNMTVSMGTINGLIFYANIIRLCEVLFLHGSVPIVTQFIAWINLDFGFETCFYNEMNQFQKSFLQFAFPFYIWSIILLIILVSRFSRRVSQMIGNNAVPVLATLILLSYTKLFRVIGTTLQYATVQLDPMNCEKSFELVWHGQPTLLYVTSKHGYLFGFSVLVLLLLAVPYTLLLLVGHNTRKILARCRCTSTWIRLKPFLDAYDAPYRDGYRCWTALFLILRVLINLMILVADEVILTIVISLVSGVLGLAIIFKGVYKKPYVNALESWFLVNLIVVASAGFYNDERSQNTTIVSVTLVMFTFLGIVLWHIYMRLLQRVCFANFVQYWSMRLNIKKRICQMYQGPVYVESSFLDPLNNENGGGDVHERVGRPYRHHHHQEDEDDDGVRMRRESLLAHSEYDDHQSDFHLMQSVDERGLMQGMDERGHNGVRSSVW